MTADLPPHPLADLFPALPADDLRRLAADIRANGQQEPVTTLDAAVLDGRSRQAACRLAGVEPAYRPFAGTDPLAFVLSKNLHRRHLTESQRAMVAAVVANMRPGDNQYAAEVSGIPLTSRVTQADAADRLNVSVDSVKAAKVVSEKGIPALAESVKAGNISVSAAAEVATLPAEEQAELVAAGPAVVKARAKEQRAKKADPPAAVVGRLLADDPTRADEAVATNAGCEPADVTALRTSLDEAGLLPTTAAEYPPPDTPPGSYSARMSDLAGTLGWVIAELITLCVHPDGRNAPKHLLKPLEEIQDTLRLHSDPAYTGAGIV